MSYPKLNPPCTGWRQDLPEPNAPLGEAPTLLWCVPAHLDETYMELSRNTMKPRGLLIWFVFISMAIPVWGGAAIAREAGIDIGMGIVELVLACFMFWFFMICYRFDVSPPRGLPLRFNRLRRKVYVYGFHSVWWNPFAPRGVTTASYDWDDLRAETWKVRGATAQGALIIKEGVSIAVVRPGTHDVITRFDLSSGGNDTANLWAYVCWYMQHGIAGLTPDHGDNTDPNEVVIPFNIALHLAPRVRWPEAMDAESRSAPGMRALDAVTVSDALVLDGLASSSPALDGPVLDVLASNNPASNALASDVPASDDPASRGLRPRVFSVAAGIYVSVAAVVSSPSLRSDFMIAWHWLRGAHVAVFDTPAAIAAHLPSVGDLVSLHGKARRAIQEYRGSPLVKHDVSSHILYWGGNAPRVDELEISDARLALYTGAFLGMSGSGSGVVSPRPLFFPPTPLPREQALDMSKAVSTVQAACADLDIESRSQYTNGRWFECDGLKYLITQQFNRVLRWPEPLDWDVLRERLAAGEARGMASRMDRDDLQKIRSYARSLASLWVRQAVDFATAQTVRSQQGGVWVYALPWNDQRIRARMPSIPSDQGRFDHPDPDPLGEWTALRAVASPQGSNDFEVEGLVTDVVAPARPGAMPYVFVDTSWSVTRLWPSVLRSALAVLAALLIVAPFCIRRQARRARPVARD